MLLDDVDDRAVREVAGDRCPGSAGVGRSEEVRLEVVVVMSVERDEGGSGSVPGREDTAHPSRPRQLESAGDVLPALPPIGRYLHLPVVSTDIQKPRLCR